MAAIAAPGAGVPRRIVLPQLLLALLATASLALAACSVGWDADQARSSYRHSTTVVLTLAALGLFLCAARWPRHRNSRHSRQPVRWQPWARGAFIGAVWSYLISLAVGPQPGVAYVFLAALMLWLSLLAWLVSTSVREPRVAARLWDRRWIRWPVLTVFWIFALLVGAELTLRLLGNWVDFAPSATWQSIAALHIGQLPSATTPSEQETALVAAAPSAAEFRVAVVGSVVDRSKGAVTDCLSRLVSLVPQIDVRSLSVSLDEFVRCQRRMSRELTASRPDLLLVLLCVDGDLVGDDAPGNAFDGQSLRLVQTAKLAFGSADLPQGQESASAQHEAEEQEPLPQCARRLAICRVPLDEAVLHHWDATLTRLDNLREHCQFESTRLAIVLVPADFQVDRTALECLCRRGGDSPTQIDLELPQRRVATYAASHNIQTVDLLPYLRAAKKSPYCRHSRQWNDAGCALVAEALAKFIATQRAAITTVAGTR